MDIYAKENVIETIVKQQLDLIIEKYWNGLEDMVIKQVVLALTLNQLSPHYATFYEGRKLQLKQIEPQLSAIRSLITNMIRKAMDVYEKGDELLPEVVNVSESIALTNIEYVLKTYHTRDKNKIKVAQIEAFILNKLPHNYAATRRGLNRYQVELNRNRPFKIQLIRKAANIVATNPRFGEPITESIRTSVIWSQQQKEEKQSNRLQSRKSGNFVNNR